VATPSPYSTMMGRRMRSLIFVRGSFTPRALRRPKGPFSHGRRRNPWCSITPDHGDGAHAPPHQQGNWASLIYCSQGNSSREQATIEVSGGWEGVMRR
jgi:hypothetical protein